MSLPELNPLLSCHILSFCTSPMLSLSLKVKTSVPSLSNLFLRVSDSFNSNSPVSPFEPEWAEKYLLLIGKS